MILLPANVFSTMYRFLQTIAVLLTQIDFNTAEDFHLPRSMGKLLSTTDN